MLAIAGGDLRASLPVPGSNDEISRMTEALVVFRDTTVESTMRNGYSSGGDNGKIRIQNYSIGSAGQSKHETRPVNSYVHWIIKY